MTLLTPLKNEKSAKPGPIRQLALLLALLLFSSSSALAYDCCIDGIYYNLHRFDNTATVVHLSDNASVGAVVVPETISYNETTYTVTEIWSGFRYCKDLTSVTIPKSVTSILDGVFSGCNSLVSIVVVPDNAVYDSRDGCNAIIETSTNKIVSGCKATIIPNTVTIIGDNAFSHCAGMTSLTIPNSITAIGEEAFAGASGLTSIVVESGNTTYDSRDNCNAIIETAENKLIVGCKNTIIPITVTAIGDGAFKSCDGLTSINIPNSVTTIGGYAFCDCSGLATVAIPSSVTSIGSHAFENCPFTTFTISNSVTFIGVGAFNCCQLLRTIVVDSGNTVYDSRNGCNAIIETSTNKLITGCRNTIIPNTVTIIGDEAFQSCMWMPSVDIPNSIVSIGERAFNHCISLTSVTIPESVTSIGNSAFNLCTSLAEVIFNAENCTRMGSPYYTAFYSYGKLSTVTIGDKVTKIPPYAFKGCSGITSVNVPNSVTSIGDEAFCKCTGLASATIGEAVTEIGGGAFSGCSGLSELVSTAVVPPTCGEGVFNGVDKGPCRLYVPEESFNQYKVADQWKDFEQTYGRSGVDDVSVDSQNAVYEVYNLQGVRVGSGMREAEVTADVLPHGVYILVSPQGRKKIQI